MNQLAYGEATLQRDQGLEWLYGAVPRVFRRLMGRDSMDGPLLQLPVAQMRLAQTLYGPEPCAQIADDPGETMGRLADRLGTGLSALTQASSRLVRNGLAERLADQNDRRVVRLRLTDKGRQWVAARRAQRREGLCRLWAALSLDERAELLRSIEALDVATRRFDIESANERMRSTHHGNR